MARIAAAGRRMGTALPGRVTTEELELAVGLESEPSVGNGLFRTLGQSVLRVFPLALSGEAFGQGTDTVAAESALDRFVELGGNLIDTADSYADGLSEIIIGNWLSRRGIRSSMVLATKVGTRPVPAVDAKSIIQSVHASLRRLKVDRIDLLFLDHDDDEVPFEETLLAVDELIRAGEVRYFGASNHPENRFIEARVMTAQIGVAPMTALQGRYNLLHRKEFESGLARLAAQQALGVMPRSGGGARVKRERLTKQGVHVIAALEKIAAEHQHTPAAIAMAWLLSKPNVVAPVMPASSAEQLPALMAAASVQLTRRQMATLDRVSDGLG